MTLTRVFDQDRPQTPEEWRAGTEVVKCAQLSHLVELAKRAPGGTDEQRHTVAQLSIRTAGAFKRWQNAGRRETWWDYAEEITRADLLALVNVAMTDDERTAHEQAALVGVCRVLDGIFKLLTAAAEETHAVRLHRCGCGQVSRNYWCSTSCYRDDEPTTGDDDGAA